MIPPQEYLKENWWCGTELHLRIMLDNCTSSTFFLGGENNELIRVRAVESACALERGIWVGGRTMIVCFFQ